ncbi:MAG: hypothetical protein JXA20_04070 [Spirochaetes bacterium]|nr:hypothetical protein [Spirochaetota bacterium]
MLYLSIVLILCGVIILLYSISVEVRRNSGPAGYVPGIAATEVRDGAIHPLEGPAGQGPPVPGDTPVRRSGQDGAAPGAAEEPVRAEEDVAPRPSAMEAEAVLYEDSSNLIDYQLATGEIDPTFEEYKKIVRIGTGDMLYEKNGVSFHMKNRFYRFDFHRFEDFAVGDNYMAIRLRGASSTKLFIVDKGRQIIAAIGEHYRNYQR